MESAKKLSEHYHNEKLDKAGKKVIDALTNEPFGLQISQLMTVCQLSNKTVREALDKIKAYQEEGFWYLPKDSEAKPDEPQTSTTQQPVKHQTLDDLGAKAIVVKRRAQEESPKPEPVKEPVQRGVEKPLSQRTDEEIRQMPLQRDRCTAVIIQWERLGLQKMKEISGADEEELMLEAHSLALRAMVDYVRDAADAFLKSLAADARAKMAESFTKKQEQPEPEAVPVEPENLPVKVAKQPEPVKNLPPAEETLPPAEKQAFSLESCKQMVTTVVTKRSELTLDIDQLNDVLKQAFGLEEISWKIQGNKILSVNLSKTETMEQ